MPGFNPERAIQALINNIAETEAKGVINGTHLMRALGAIGDYCKIYSLTQISGAPCDELRVEIGGLIRLFSDFVLSGRIEDYETFAKKGIELSFTCSSPGRLTPEEVSKLLNQAPKRRGATPKPKTEESCANCEFNTVCMVQTGYCPSWKRG